MPLLLLAANPFYAVPEEIPPGFILHTRPALPASPIPPSAEYPFPANLEAPSTSKTRYSGRFPRAG